MTTTEDIIILYQSTVKKLRVFHFLILTGSYLAILSRLWAALTIPRHLFSYRFRHLRYYSTPSHPSFPSGYCREYFLALIHFTSSEIIHLSYPPDGGTMINYYNIYANPENVFAFVLEFKKWFFSWRKRKWNFRVVKHIGRLVWRNDYLLLSVYLK